MIDEISLASAQAVRLDGPCPAIQIAAASMFLSVAHDEPLSFRWSIYRRRTPPGVKLTEGGITSFHAAHAASWKVLEELVENILKEDKSTARPV
jgi:hypothetical protein